MIRNLPYTALHLAGAELHELPGPPANRRAADGLLGSDAKSILLRQADECIHKLADVIQSLPCSCGAVSV